MMRINASTLLICGSFLAVISVVYVQCARQRDSLMPAPLRIERSHSASVVERVQSVSSAGQPSLSTQSTTSSLRDLHLDPSISSQQDLLSPRNTRRLIRQTPVVSRLPVDTADRGRFPTAAPRSTTHATVWLPHTSVDLSRWERVLLQYRTHDYEAAVKGINRLSYASLPVHYNRALIYIQLYLKTGNSQLLHCALMDADRAIGAIRHFYPAYVIKARISFLMRRYRMAYDLLLNLHDLIELQVSDRSCILYDTREFVGLIYMGDILVNMALTAWRFGSEQRSNDLFAAALESIRRDMQRDEHDRHLTYIYEQREAQYRFMRDNKLLIPDLAGAWMEPIKVLSQTELIPTQFTTARDAFSVRLIQALYTTSEADSAPRTRDRSPLIQVTTANDIIMGRQTLPGEVVSHLPHITQSETVPIPMHQFSMNDGNPNDDVITERKKKKGLKRLISYCFKSK